MAEAAKPEGENERSKEKPENDDYRQGFEDGYRTASSEIQALRGKLISAERILSDLFAMSEFKERETRIG